MTSTLSQLLWASIQEWIELDLFHGGLARFTVNSFTDVGLGPEARSLIEVMADQESGHATLLTNMLGPRATKECVYDYPYTTVREWVDCMQRITRFGESGVWGFINHLDSRKADHLLRNPSQQKHANSRCSVKCLILC